MFDQNVVVICLGGFQVWIPEALALRARVGIDDFRRNEVADVGTRKSPAEVHAYVRVPFDLILNLRAWQSVEVTGTLVEGRDGRIPLGVQIDCIDRVSGEVCIGAIKADTRLQPELTNRNGILHIPGVDSLIGIEEGALRFLYAGDPLEPENRVRTRQIRRKGLS